MPQFDGSYVRGNGARRTYTYTVTYGMRGPALGWTAHVHCGEADKGKPGGEYAYDLPPPEDEQRRMAEQLTQEAIEALDGVAE